MRARAFTLILATSAAPTAAEVPFLDLPLDCTLGKTCFIEDYVDADSGIAQHDYTCGLKSRNDHKGTDFALTADAAGVGTTNVLAAARGQVEAVRDEIPDRPYSAEIAAELSGRECGNAVRLRHANGLQTLYCHMKRGTVAVKSGDIVESGETLGEVGMSGQSNFPHVHITVLRDGDVIDPFNPTATGTCGPLGDTLWKTPPPYSASGLFTASFTTSVPSLAHVQSGDARRVSARTDDDLVLYGFAFFTETGDEMRFDASGPQGDVFSHAETIDRGRAQLFRAFGRRAPDTGWTEGVYTGSVTLLRDGEILAQRQATITLQPH